MINGHTVPDNSSPGQVVALAHSGGLEEQLDVPSEGRRLYIHRYSFRCLVAQDPKLGRRICDTLAVVRAGKIIHHQVTDLGSDLGLVRREIAQQLASVFGWKAQLSELFRELGYRPCFPSDKSVILPMLDGTEAMVASCTEAGYYTFATGAAASNRMFMDHEPIPALQKALSAGVGPKDLTIIRGRSIAAIRPELGIGEVGYAYARFLGSRVVGEAQVDSIDTSARASCLRRMQDEVKLMSPTLTSDERSIMRDLTGCISNSFHITGSV